MHASAVAAIRTDMTDMTGSILSAAFCRSLGHEPRLIPFGGCHIMLCGESSAWSPQTGFSGKAVVFGAPPEEMLGDLGLARDPSLASLENADACPPACGEAPFTESPGYLAYSPHGLLGGLSASLRRRPFCRFDYADEWNNLGFGRIRADASPWGVSPGHVTAGAVELASMRRLGEDNATACCGSYLTLYDTTEATVLWCARPVGPVDSTEWSIIERFLSDWRPDDMPCLPVLEQVPAGCHCLVTMRLDCDEAVASATRVFNWYRAEGLPFSLALKTSLELAPDDRALLQAVSDSGGAVLSHSHTHPPNWGATPEQALEEARISRDRLTALLPTNAAAMLAVSPFHTNPPSAVRALETAGYQGFVGGIIHNDPEYLLGRAGLVPFAEKGIVSISQQSMLHGDCYRRQGCTVDAHMQAFEAQYQARGIFGYLDHPFSDRYQYDWASEEQRLRAHAQLVQRIRSFDGAWFWPQQACFEFVRALAGVRPYVARDGRILSETLPAREDIACRYHGRHCRVHPASGERTAAR